MDQHLEIHQSHVVTQEYKNVVYGEIMYSFFYIMQVHSRKMPKNRIRNKEKNYFELHCGRRRDNIAGCFADKSYITNTVSKIM